jgi:ATP-dependent DNA ligase
MPFIPPMLCSRLQDAACLTDPRYVAEPKLDGQRAQLHVHLSRTVHLYSRPGRDLLRHPGMSWLREIAWPFPSAVLDGEAVAGDGHEGIQSVFTERNGIGGDLAFLAFDGHRVYCPRPQPLRTTSSSAAASTLRIVGVSG